MELAVADAPKYPPIAEKLRERLMSGQYCYGDKFLSELQIMNEFGVSRPTAHRALLVLADDGLVEVKQGRGVTVRAWKPILRNVTGRMSAEVWGQGRSVWADETAGRDFDTETSVREGAAPDEVAQHLQVSAVWMRRRRHFVDRRLVMLSVSYYPTAMVGGSAITEENTGPGGAPARLAELGHAPVRHYYEMRVRRPTAEERDELELSTGSRVVEWIRVSFDAQKAPVEVTRMVSPDDAFVFQVEHTS